MRHLPLTLLLLAGVAAACSAPSDPDGVASDDALTSADLFSLQSIEDVRIAIDAPGVDSLRKDPRTYVKASIALAGATYDAEIKIKGGWGSSRPFDDKPALKVKFAKKTGPAGLKKLTLNNMVQDPSMVHEAMAYPIYEAAGVPASRTGYARVWVNDNLYGLYADIETVDPLMLARYYDDATGPLYENGYDQLADLQKDQVDHFELNEGTDDQQTALRAFIDAVHTDGDGALYGPTAVLDTKRFVSLMAAATLLGDWDGYWKGNNFRIYRDPKTSLWTVLPSGLDQTYGTRLSPFASTSVLFQKCMSSTRCATDYVNALVRVAPLLETSKVVDKVAPLVAVIDAAAKADTRRPYSPDDMNAARDAMRAFIASRRNAVQMATHCLAAGGAAACLASAPRSAACGFQQTGQCSGFGPREPQNDKACNVAIDGGASGTCDCADQSQYAFDCGHPALTCDNVCRGHGGTSLGTCAWRQTGQCSGHGPREPQNDKACADVLDPAWSGFCECSPSKNVFFDCAHAKVSCATACGLTP